MKNLMDKTQSAFETFWDPVIDEEKSAEQALRDFFSEYFRNLAKAQLQMIMMQLWNVVFGNIFSGFTGLFFPQKSSIPAAVAHTGGIIGQDYFPTRMVPRATFNEAPKFHDLKSNEVAIVAERGETILSKDSSIGGNTVNINITAMDSQDVQRVLYKNRRTLSDLFLMGIKSNHPSGRYER